MLVSGPWIARLSGAAANGAMQVGFGGLNIAAATRVNAQIIGKGRELGSIEPGKIADVIVVTGNPLFDITALSHVEVVVKDGVIYKGGPAGAPSRNSSGK